ncbi:hypothetical protein CFOL_v3_06991 [Cephalotus follicularis]|uniref:Uncharacterized protein n=1 Tax=Cephalotus follicularis TaxID=3775 RepID=A0A1Q3B6S4_CEPFO|nr:hypothetical protein CFOL_v3_06991 [Cephalotus follicularis]
MSMMKSNRKPPLPKSPIRVGPRRSLRSNSTSLQTPQVLVTGSLKTHQKPIPWEMEEEAELRPEYQSISWELRALAKMVRNELGNGDTDNAGVTPGLNADSSPLFKRGRFYDEYSARRNERLKRKMGGGQNHILSEPNTPYNLGVTVESSKKRDSKKLESLRKSVSDAFSVERSENQRYMLRSMSKESKKPPLPHKSVLASERKLGPRRVTRKI